MHKYKVGVVTVTYNSAEVLPDFFRSIWNQTHTDFVLYAIDNASKDTTVTQLRAETDPRLRIEPSPTNVGVAEGNNIGIRMALGEGCDGVLLINNDVVFPSRLISTLIDSLEANHSDMVAPKMMYFDQPDRIWWAGGYFQPYFGYRAVHRGLDEVDTGQWDKPARAAYTPTCCVLVNRSIFSEIGMMDAKYFVYADDTDFMLRAYKAKLLLIYEPSAVLLHKVSSLTSGTNSPFAVHLCSRNRVYYWTKHLGIPLTCLYTAGLSALYVLQFALRMKASSTLKVQIKAMRDGFRLA